MLNSKQLSGRTALITGGTSGIGKATAVLFCQAGANIVFTGRRAKLGKSVEAELQALGGNAVFISADHTNPEDCQRVINESLAKFGSIDILFNNAGIVVSGTAEETSEDAWSATIELNVTAVWRMSKLVIPIMRAQKGGVIINNASDWGVVAGKQAVAYCTSKGAVIQLTKAIALDHARENIRINAVCPGDTFVKRWENEGYFKGSGSVSKDEIITSGQALPIGRVAHVDEIAQAVLFLASDASSYITGTALIVDGGNTAR